MSRTLFISYSHAENEADRWVERLTAFLDGVREKLPLVPWPDTKIRSGDQWRARIDAAIAQAGAAILLIGPQFLSSSFIRDDELPALLTAADAGRLRLYPLVVRYVVWEHTILERYQAFNDPAKPLEAMVEHQQNRWLNELCRAVLNDARQNGIVVESAAALTVSNALALAPGDVSRAMAALRDHLRTTHTAFRAQADRRNALYAVMRRRLGVTDAPEFERFFFRHHADMTAEEQFDFRQIRALTEGPLHDGNAAMLALIDAHPALRDELPIVAALRQHLLIWLNKYDRVFASTPQMCVLYTGVEDGVPFPFGVDDLVDEWLASRAPR